MLSKVWETLGSLINVKSLLMLFVYKDQLRASSQPSIHVLVCGAINHCD